MRLAQLSESFGIPSETFVYELHKELADRLQNGYRLFTFNRFQPEIFPSVHVDLVSYSSPSIVDNISAKAKSFCKSSPYVSRHWRNQRIALKNALSKFAPTIIHAHFGPLAIIAAPVARSLRIPLIVTFHGYDVSKIAQDKCWLSAYNLLIKNEIHAIGVSNHICSKIHDRIGIDSSRIHLVHGGINIENFHFSPPSDRFDGNNLKLLCIGRIVAKKSPLELVDAVRLARQRVGDLPRITLTWIGDGILRDKLESHIANNKIAGIDLRGAQSPERIREALSTHHLYTQMACTAPDGDEEGQGITLVEAMATGLPIVTVRHNGFPDVIDSGTTGFLVDEHDVQGFASRIAELASRPESWRKISEASRLRVISKFTIGKQTDKFLSICSALCRNAT
jgi:colanic acid/amylovoran biosynthesis glycosyltransferase